MTVGNHTRSPGTSCASAAQSGCAEAISLKTTGKYMSYYCQKINTAFLFTPSRPLLATLSASRSLIMFMCPWQTHVLRMHHIELKLAFDVPLITSGAKPKDIYSVGEGGKEMELTSWAVLFEYG